MKFYSALFALAFLAACSQDLPGKETCTAVLIEDCNCLQVYEPVCGCDNVTYSNDCFAGCSSIESYTEGECP